MSDILNNPSERQRTIERLRRMHPHNADIMAVCRELEILAADGTRRTMDRPRFTAKRLDETRYMREYMREYRRRPQVPE